MTSRSARLWSRRMSRARNRSTSGSLASCSSASSRALRRGSSRSGVKSVICNRVYRGELRDGDELVCENAHQPLLSEGEWKLAQLGGIGPLYVKDGSIAAQGLLTSLVFCAACGHRLSLTGSTAKNGERVAN